MPHNEIRCTNVIRAVPGRQGLPSRTWNLKPHVGDTTLRLCHYGNEIIVGLMLQFALESQLGPRSAGAVQPVLKRI